MSVPSSQCRRQLRSAKYGPGRNLSVAEHAHSERSFERLEGFLSELNFDKSGGPGDNGAGVSIPKEREEEMKELFKLNQFNLMASNMISVNRNLPDYRSAKYTFLVILSYFVIISLVIISLFVI